MARVKNGLEAVQVINTFLFSHADLVNYKINDEIQNIYFDTDSDLFDIESDFEKGLPANPIITTFLVTEPRNPDKNIMSSFTQVNPVIKLDICVPHKDRKTSYREGLKLAYKVADLIDKDLSITLYDSFKECKTVDITRLGSKKFNEKGIYSPQRINLRVQL